MQEPYALYKHNACMCLAEIELRRKNFSKALVYIKLFDKKYPYQHFCANELMEEQKYTTTMYKQAYLGLQDTTSLINLLLPNAFGDGLFLDTMQVNDIVKLLQARYDKKYLAMQHNNSIDQLKFKTIKQKKNRYRINLIRIRIPNHRLKLKPGMPAYVTINSRKNSALSLPIEAVIRDDKSATVWVQTGPNTFASRMVLVGKEIDDRIVIQSGILPGDIVVISGTY